MTEQAKPSSLGSIINLILPESLLPNRAFYPEDPDPNRKQLIGPVNVMRTTFVIEIAGSAVAFILLAYFSMQQKVVTTTVSNSVLSSPYSCNLLSPKSGMLGFNSLTSQAAHFSTATKTTVGCNSALNSASNNCNPSQITWDFLSLNSYNASQLYCPAMYADGVALCHDVLVDDALSKAYHGGYTFNPKATLQQSFPNYINYPSTPSGTILRNLSDGSMLPTAFDITKTVSSSFLTQAGFAPVADPSLQNIYYVDNSIEASTFQILWKINKLSLSDRLNTPSTVASTAQYTINSFCGFGSFAGTVLVDAVYPGTPGQVVQHFYAGVVYTDTTGLTDTIKNGILHFVPQYQMKAMTFPSKLVIRPSQSDGINYNGLFPSGSVDINCQSTNKVISIGSDSMYYQMLTSTDGLTSYLYTSDYAHGEWRTDPYSVNLDGGTYGPNPQYTGESDTSILHASYYPINLNEISSFIVVIVSSEKYLFLASQSSVYMINLSQATPITARATPIPTSSPTEASIPVTSMGLGGGLTDRSEGLHVTSGLTTASTGISLGTPLTPVFYTYYAFYGMGVQGTFSIFAGKRVFSLLLTQGNKPGTFYSVFGGANILEDVSQGVIPTKYADMKKTGSCWNISDKTTCFVQQDPLTGPSFKYLHLNATIGWRFGVCNNVPVNTTAISPAFGLPPNFNDVGECPTPDGYYIQDSFTTSALAGKACKDYSIKNLKSCPALAAAVSSRLSSSCPSLVSKACSVSYDLNPPYICSTTTGPNIATVVGGAFANASAIFSAVCAFFYYIYTLAVFKRYKKKMYENEKTDHEVANSVASGDPGIEMSTTNKKKIVPDA